MMLMSCVCEWECDTKSKIPFGKSLILRGGNNQAMSNICVENSYGDYLSMTMKQKSEFDNIRF